MTAEDGAFHEIEARIRMSTTVIDDHFSANGFSPSLNGCIGETATIVDEDCGFQRVEFEDKVRGLGGVDNEVRVVHEEEALTDPVGAQTPRRGMNLGEFQDTAARIQGGIELGILLFQGHTASLQESREAFRIFHILDETLKGDNRVHHATLDGQFSQSSHDLAEAAVLKGGVVPTINAIDRVEPGGSFLLGIEETVGHDGGALCGVDGAALRRPMVLGSLVMVDTTDAVSASIQPLRASLRGNGNIQEQNVGARHGGGGGPGMRLRRADGMKAHVGTAIGLKVKRGDGRAAQAIDTVAVEEHMVITAFLVFKEGGAKGEGLRAAIHIRRHY